jgi:hypothetical protein
MVGLQRKTPMKRGGPLRRKTWLTPVNRKRRKKMHERNFGERAKLVREMPCLAAPKDWSFDEHNGHERQCSWPIQAAHVKARGMGGCGGDRRQLVPLCAKHHAEAGERNTSQRAAFEERHGLDLQAEARRIAEHFDQMGIP